MALTAKQTEQIVILLKTGDLSNRAIAKLVKCSETKVRTTKKKLDNDELPVYDGTNESMGVVYIINAEGSNAYKIGVAADVSKRLSQLQTANHQKLVVVRTFFSNKVYALESKLHKRHKSKRIRGEWFELSKEDIFNMEEVAYGNI